MLLRLVQVYTEDGDAIYVVKRKEKKKVKGKNLE